jgi:predicted N-acyltransferase
LEIKIYRKIEEVEPFLWDSLMKEKKLLKGKDFLKAVEDSKLTDSEYWYLLFFDNSKLIAHTSLFSVYTYVNGPSTGKTNSVISRMRKYIPSFLRLKIIACGTPIATCSNTLTIFDEQQREQVIGELCKTMIKIAKRQHAHIVLFRDFNASELNKLDSLQRKGFVRAFTLPTTFLDVKWTSFDSYINSFRSQRKAKAKRDIRDFGKGDFDIEICRDFSRYADELYNLYCNVYEKSESKFEKLTPEFFANMSQNLKNNICAILVWDRGKLIAFDLILEEQELLSPLYLGIDYTYNNEYKIYFNMIFQIIKYGIESGKKVIELGQTTYFPKLNVGARMEPLYIFIKFRNRILHKFLAPFVELFFPKIDCHQGYALKE